MGSLCLSSFVVVVYAAGAGDLGNDCNDKYNSSCDIVFRARSTTYATLSFLLLVTAWEVKHFTRSLFHLNPTGGGTFSLFDTVWRNKTLFWAVVVGFFVTFPVVYIPSINLRVFKHMGIGWEWSIVGVALVLYLVAIEGYKAVKRRIGFGGVKGVGLDV